MEVEGRKQVNSASAFKADSLASTQKGAKQRQDHQTHFLRILDPKVEGI
jgi:hypothetical protein